MIHAQIVCNGQPLRIIPHDGKHYVQAPEKGEYIIRLQNRTAMRWAWSHSPPRRLAVVSVDGRCVLDGKPAKADGKGFVLSPGQIMDIPGWRLDSGNVAKFEFGAVGESYGAAMGDATHSGVIGVIGYPEKQRLQVQWSTGSHNMGTYGNGGLMKGGGVLRGGGYAQSKGGVFMPLGSSSSTLSLKPASLNAQAPSAVRDSASTKTSASVMNAPDLGTGFGEKTEFKTRTVTFERGPEETRMVFHYRTEAWLLENGILPVKETSVPSAFPADDVGCAIPAGWGE